jgi:hypothetical protein
MSITPQPNGTDSRRLAWLVGGGLVLLLLAWWLTVPSDELVGVVPPPAAQAPVAVTAAPAPATMAIPADQAAAPAAPATSAATPEGLRLFGLLGSGAIIGLPDGSQRLVRIGREVLPSLTLVEVRQHNVLLRSATGDITLDFGGVAQPGGPAAAHTARPAGDAAQREEVLRYRLGLAPRMEGGRVAGFTIRPGANLPALQRAGLRPGDTILSVNGSRLDEERMMELAWTIANSDRTEFEYERDGRRMRAAVR